jgi:predicted NBD/HSP70 family sugar kinase
LLEYGHGAWDSAEDLIASSNQGDTKARKAVETHAAWVGAGCVSIHNVLDPELIVLSGGLAQKNPLLLQLVGERLQSTDPAWKYRPVRVVASDLGYFAGVLGATAIAQSVNASSNM